MKIFCPQEILKQQSLRMFELVQKHPPHWPPFVPPTKPEVTTTGAGAVLTESSVAEPSSLAKRAVSTVSSNCTLLRAKYSPCDETPCSYRISYLCPIRPHTIASTEIYICMFSQYCKIL